MCPLGFSLPPTPNRTIDPSNGGHDPGGQATASLRRVHGPGGGRAAAPANQLHSSWFDRRPLPRSSAREASQTAIFGPGWHRTVNSVTLGSCEENGSGPYRPLFGLACHPRTSSREGLGGWAKTPTNVPFVFDGIVLSGTGPRGPSGFACFGHSKSINERHEVLFQANRFLPGFVWRAHRRPFGQR